MLQGHCVFVTSVLPNYKNSAFIGNLTAPSFTNDLLCHRFKCKISQNTYWEQFNRNLWSYMALWQLWPLHDNTKVTGDTMPKSLP